MQFNSVDRSLIRSRLDAAAYTYIHACILAHLHSYIIIIIIIIVIVIMVIIIIIAVILTIIIILVILVSNY